MPPAQMALDFGLFRPPLRIDAGPERVRVERDLERALSSWMRMEVALSFTDNARTMISARHRNGVAHVRLHHMFAGADERTLRAVARFLTSGDRVASDRLRRFIRTHDHHIRRHVSQVRVRAGGHHHDLRAIFDHLNATYFESAVVAQIGWARTGRAGGKRRSIKLGSYRCRDALIRVHPVLDAAWVPRFFVEYIVYHEMLHQVVGMPIENGRRDLHGRRFREREQLFARYTDAIAWEQANLDRLLSG